MEIMRVYKEVKNVFIEGKGWVKKTPSSLKNATMYEVSYIDYLEDGTVYDAGTEDIPVERHNALKRFYYCVKENRGEKYPSGRACWDIVGTFYFRVSASDSKKAVKAWKKSFGKGRILRFI